MRYILASASPRRRELLKNVGLEFEVIISDIDEIVDDNLTPGEIVMDIAKQKAMAVYQNINPRDTVIISADTVVCLDNKILGKPKSEEEAEEILSALSGRRHQVFSGVCIIKEGYPETFYSCSQVDFHQLSTQEILDYINSGEPMDKAGAYGIQGKGSLFVKSISGDYFNIVGLPVAETMRRIKL